MPNLATLHQRRAWSSRKTRLNVPFLDENLTSPDPLVQEKAVAAFPSFLGEYLKDRDDGSLLRERRDNVLEGYLKEINSSELHRRGISLALGNRFELDYSSKSVISTFLLFLLGSFPDFALCGRVEDVLQKLMSCVEITKDTEKWAEGRRDAVLAVSAIVKTVGVKTVKGSFVTRKGKERA